MADAQAMTQAIPHVAIVIGKEAVQAMAVARAVAGSAQRSEIVSAGPKHFLKMYFDMKYIIIYFIHLQDICMHLVFKV